MASSYGTDADKSSLRSNYLRVRRTLAPASRAVSDAAIRRSLLALDVVREAPVVLSYVSCGAEVDTRSIIETLLAEGRRVAVPRCDPELKVMCFCEISSLSELAPGAHGLPEPPDSAPELPVVPDLVGSVCLVPGLVFDAEGHRVGYGGGYYDRFLAFYPGEKIGLARVSQLSSNPLPHDAHDVAVDLICTEGAVWSCR